MRLFESKKGKKRPLKESALSTTSRFYGSPITNLNGWKQAHMLMKADTIRDGKIIDILDKKMEKFLHACSTGVMGATKGAEQLILSAGKPTVTINRNEDIVLKFPSMVYGGGKNISFSFSFENYNFLVEIQSGDKEIWITEIS